MPVSARIVSTMTAVVTLTDSKLSASDKGVTITGLNDSLTLDADSAAPASEVVASELTLSSGAGTIDLRALTGVNGGSVDGNGKKVQAFKFRSKAGNANPITVTFGASNGYLLLGTAWKCILPVAESYVDGYLKDGAPDISASTKTIDVAGTGSQVLEYELVIG